MEYRECLRLESLTVVDETNVDFSLVTGVVMDHALAVDHYAHGFGQLI